MSLRSRLDLAETVIEFVRREGITDPSEVRSFLMFAAQMTYQMEGQTGSPSAESRFVPPQS